MHTPVTYEKVVRILPNLTTREQIRLLSLLATPRELQRAMRKLRGEMYRDEVERRQKEASL